jgi:putative transcriptional regulator
LILKTVFGTLQRNWDYNFFMQIKPGTIIKSTAALNNSVFNDVIIIITEYNANGATGFITNKIFERPLNALQEFSYMQHFALYNGGPVNQEHLFFIHRRPDVIEGGQKVCNEVFYGGNFTQAVTAINNYTLTENDIKIFIGYCGWDAGELEAEIEEGSWEIIEMEPTFIFI